MTDNGADFNERVEATAFAGMVSAKIDNVAAEVGIIRKDVGDIKATVNQAAGAWKTLALIGSLLGGFATVLGALNAMGVFKELH